MKKVRSGDSVLLRYSGIVSALLAAAGVKAQPDTVLTVVDTTLDKNGQSFDIDLDTNGVVDFRINQIVDSTNFNITGVTIQARGPAANQVLGIDYGNYNYPFKLEVGDTIGPGEVFKGVGVNDRLGYLGLIVDGNTYPNSQFVNGITDGFLGVRFEGNLDSLVETYYGWIRVDVAADLRSITIKDYAYITVPDQLIRAGFGSPIGVEEMKLTQVEFAQRGQYLDYKFPDNHRGEVVFSFFDLSGRLIEKRSKTEAKGTISLSGLPKGVLVAVIQSGAIEASKKIVIY
jgi:hypothetical protein